MEAAYRAFNLKQRVKSEALLRYEICKAMGWNYYIYEEQPPFFIEEIRLIMNQEVQAQNTEVEKASGK